MSDCNLYLNHAGTSWPKPPVVTDAVTEAMSCCASQWTERFNEAHQAIAEYFGVRQREEILLTPGCTSSLATAIGDSFIESGKRVLTSGWEHHALHRPLLKLAAQGIAVDYIPQTSGNEATDDSPLIDLDWLEQSLAKRDVAMIAITAACNVTGDLLPYQDVIRVAHSYDAMVLLDAAQIVGWLDLDLPQIGADIVAFGGHKGLQGPWGIGGLYISDRARMECVSATCDLPSALGGEGKHGPRPDYCDVGSVDQCALAGLHAAVMMLQDSDTTELLSTARASIDRIQSALERIDGVRLLGARIGNQRMPTIAFTLPGFSSTEVANRLKQADLIVGSGIQCAPLAHQSLGTQEAGVVRLSVGLGQRKQDIDAAIPRLNATLRDLCRC